jgi:hypothetical protein
MTFAPIYAFTPAEAADCAVEVQGVPNPARPAQANDKQRPANKFLTLIITPLNETLSS